MAALEAARQADRVDRAFAAYAAHIEAKLDWFRAELIKWMFLFWVGSVGLALALRLLG